MQRCDTCSASRAINVAALAKCIKQAEKELEHARSLPNSGKLLCAVLLPVRKLINLFQQSSLKGATY